MTISDWISIGGSVITIISMIVSGLFAAKARKYKIEAIKSIRFSQLNSFIVSFTAQHDEFVKNTSSLDWFKGRDSSLICNEFANVIRKSQEFDYILSDSLKKNRNDLLQKLYRPEIMESKISKRKVYELLDSFIGRLRCEADSLLAGGDK